MLLFIAYFISYWLLAFYWNSVMAEGFLFELKNEVVQIGSYGY